MYCTNCGEKCNKKICPKCGVKIDKTHYYCKFCGGKLNDKASLCTNCYEKIEDSIYLKILNVFDIIFMAIIAVLIISFIILKYYITAILFLVSFILISPFFRKKIKEKYYDVKVKKTIIQFIRIVLIITLLLVGSSFIDVDQYYIYNDDAINEAENYFHSVVYLKDESSYVLNDASVKYDSDMYEDDSYEYTYVYVILDYSAKNGFGGYNRDEYKIKMKFNKTTGEYYDKEEYLY